MTFRFADIHVAQATCKKLKGLRGGVRITLNRLKMEFLITAVRKMFWDVRDV